MNVTVTVQLAPPATDVPHVLVCEKFPDSFVEIATPFKAVVPRFVKVKVCPALVFPRF